MKTMIVYSSKYGATENCAQLLMEKLGEDTMSINLSNGESPKFDDVDTIMVGSSIYAGKMRPDIIKFITENEHILKNKEFGIFLSCKDEGAEALSYIEQNLPEWVQHHAFVKSALGHEINLEKMNFIERSILKMVFKVKTSYSKLNQMEMDRVVEEIKNLK